MRINKFYASVLLACGVAVVLSNIVVAELQTASVNSRMLAVQQASSADVLCVGSSHFQRAIDPRQFDQRVVNLNHPGLNYEFAEYVLRPRLEESSSIQTVVLEIGYTPLFRNTAESPYLAIWQLDPAPDISKIAPVALTSQFVPILRSPKQTPAAMLQQLLRGSQTNTKEIVPGYEESLEVMLASGSERATYHNTLYFTKNSAANTAAFWRIIEMCETGDVNIALLALPYADGYKDALKPELVSGLDAFRKEIDAYGLTVVDCSVRKWAEEEFRDGDHVNSRGAKEVAKLLNHQLSLMVNEQ